jgi:hypothetical protein
MQDDDAATVETLTKYRSIFSDFVNRHEGRIVDSPGDNILAEFDSPVEAVQCAVELQRDLARRNRQLADHRQMHFRIGINLGDILSRDDGTIYGDGVNVAARLESLAEPGGFPTAREKYGVSYMQGDYAKIAEGMGAVGLRVEKVSEMAPALEQAKRLNADGKTVLIDVRSNLEAKRSRY